jgi:hypothetical protein
MSDSKERKGETKEFHVHTADNYAHGNANTFKRPSHIQVKCFAGAWQQLNKMNEKGNRTLLLIVSLIFNK